tara:strand:- start:255 stop:2963 length:2709 start_codon:yes stop_codon:yes gene_type:complete
MDFDYKAWEITSIFLAPFWIGLYLYASIKSNDEGGWWTFGKFLLALTSFAHFIGSIVLLGHLRYHPLAHNNEEKAPMLIIPSLLSSIVFSFILTSGIEQIFPNIKSFLNNKVVAFKEILKGIINGEIFGFGWNRVGQVFIYTILLAVLGTVIYFFQKWGFEEKNTENNINFGVSLAFIFFMCIVSIGLIKSEMANKNTVKLLSIMLHRQNITWTVFFISFLSFGIPFLINNRNKVKKEEEEELDKCGDGKREDTPTTHCEDDVLIKSNKKISSVEYPFYIILFIMISLLMGINIGKIKENFYKDQTKGLIILFCLGLFMSFIMYQIDREKNINVYSQENSPTIAYKARKAGYLIGNIIFLIMGFIGLFSLIKVQNNPADRPDFNNLKGHMFWLFEKIKSDLLSSALYLGGLFAFVSFFFTILNKKTIEIGVTGHIVQLIYLMIGLSLIVMLYKFLINSQLMKKFPVIKILLNLIFFIPCILFGIVEFLHNDFTNTPKVVYVILLGQIILISSYILIPLIVKNLLGLVKIKKNSGELNNLKKKTSEKKVDQKQEEINELKKVVGDKIGENMWNEIIGKSIYNDINELYNYLKINTNIQDKKFYVNKIVAEKTKKEMDLLEEDELKSMKNAIDNDDWSEDCDNFNTCNTNSNNNNNEIFDLSCNLSNYTIYTHLVGYKISKGMDELTKLKLEKKNAAEKDEKYFDTNTQLVSKPIYLDRKTETDKTFQNLEDCGTYDFSGNFTHSGVSDCNQSYNYGLSLWVNLHAQPPNKNPSYNKYTTIINYSNNPKISYNMKENKLRVEILRNGQTHEMFTIFDKNVLKMQKWNNIVINYNLGIVEVFVNSKLLVTNDVILPYIKSDKIVIGEENGISGGICNVVYYPTKLTNTEISLLYNSLKLRNPPIV